MEKDNQGFENVEFRDVDINELIESYQKDNMIAEFDDGFEEEFTNFKDPLTNIANKQDLDKHFSSPNRSEHSFNLDSGEDLDHLTKKLKNGNNSKGLKITHSNKHIKSGIDNINYYEPDIYGRFVTATNSKGETLYIPRKSESTLRFSSSIQKREEAKKDGLLSVSIYKLLDKIEAERALEIETNLKNKLKIEGTKEKNIKKELWVDKYRPKSYIDLVGNENLNFSALEWLRQWDYCVFNKEPQSSSNIANENLLNGEKNLDPYSRPEHKMMLFCGPPGIGKTSLAHVISRHCGYNVIEINASDDRTSNVVKDRIITASEMKSMFGDQKPNLIIIDEIDGVSSAGGADSFINMLIQLTGNEDTTSSSKKKIKPLRRPIICICNDQFAPALRNLRQHCQIFQFRKLSPSDLVSHLKFICRTEKIEASHHTLNTLCELTDFDIRSSINTLQYLSESFERKITYETVVQGQSGLKDAPKSIFAILDLIFTLPSSRVSITRKRAIDDELGIYDAKDKYCEQLVSMINTHGGYNLIFEGCFENYLTSQNVDLYLDRVCRVNEYMHLYDQVNVRAYNQQQSELLAYIPHIISSFHPLFATVYCNKMEYPKSERILRENLNKNRMILLNFYNHLDFKMRFSITLKDISQYFANLLHSLICPNLNRINVSNLKTNEREIINSLVNKMIQLKLRFIQHKDEHDNLAYILDPPINVVTDIELNGLPKMKKNKMRNEVIQFISQEVEREILKRKEIKMMKISDLQVKSNKKAPAVKNFPILDNKKRIGDELTNKLTKTKINPFASFIKPKSVEQLNLKKDTIANSVPKKNKPKIWFKFNDGYSNAVRKQTLMKDFL